MLSVEIYKGFLQLTLKLSFSALLMSNLKNVVFIFLLLPQFHHNHRLCQYKGLVLSKSQHIFYTNSAAIMLHPLLYDPVESTASFRDILAMGDLLMTFLSLSGIV